MGASVSVAARRRVIARQDIGHDHEAFLARARLTQEAVAQRMDTAKSAVSRLERAGKHTPSVGTLQRYAKAVGCERTIELVAGSG